MLKYFFSPNMNMAEDCIFCKIIKGDIPSKRFYESNSVMAFLDIFPAALGHTVVIPKEHYYNLLDYPDEKISSFFQELKKVANLLKQKLGSDGFNIVQNNFPAAGQVVPHFHYHIIPRKEGDNAFKMKSSPTKASEEELNVILSKLK